MTSRPTDPPAPPESTEPREILDADAFTVAEVTVVVCDIRGFTQLAEKLGPSGCFRLVTAFLQTLGEAVTEAGGTINNLTGDGFLAQFGVGLFAFEHAVRALNCAVGIRERMAEFNRTRHLGKSATLAVGLGIHSGPIAGGPITVGDYAGFLMVGDTVNSAARIEALTKDFSVDILVSERTRELAASRFPLKAMPTRAAKGKADPLRTHWLMPTARVVPLEG